MIFNHLKFDDEEFKPRFGTEADVISLRKTLLALNFEVEVHHDLRIKEIKNQLEKLSAEDHRDADCVLVAVLTHGEEGRLIDVEGTDYSQEELWKPFLEDVPIKVSLVGKPKIFLIQACRGSQVACKQTK